jgi:molecular chaperone Hsp33
VERQEDHLIQATTADSTIRLIAAVTTGVVAEGCRRHQTSPTASAALGRALTGALLFGSTFKDLEYITLRFDCRGPIGQIVAEANAHGTVRGYVRNPQAEAESLTPGKLNVAGVVGRGLLQVIREAGQEIGLAKEPYTGAVPLVSGEIAEDLAHYLATSEQINSAVGLGVYIDTDGESVAAAGGYLIQVMPGIEEETLVRLETMLSRAPHITDRVRQGASAEEMLLEAIGDFELTVLNRRSVDFKCTCSYERAIGIVTALGEEEVADMLKKDRGAEMTCHFCREVYHLDEAALEGILSPPVN